MKGSSEGEALLEVVVVRDTWLRGGQPSVLRNPDTGHMCCMGFGCLAAGHERSEIDRLGTVAEIGKDGGNKPRPALRHFRGTDPEEEPWLPDPRNPYPSDTDHSVRELIYSINDDDAIDDVERERHLTTLGPKAGIAFRFTGTPLPRHSTALIPAWTDLFRNHEPDEELPPTRATIRLLDPQSRQWRLERSETAENGHETSELIRNAHDALGKLAEETRQAARIDVEEHDGTRVLSVYREPPS